MRHWFVMLLLCVLLTGCESNQLTPILGISVVKQECPVVNIPLALRQKNWTGNQREGSCVHAAMISLMRWQGRNNLVNYFRPTNGNGAWPDDLAAKFDREKVRYAYTENGDVKFIEWACRTRRGCGITIMGGSHMVALG